MELQLKRPEYLYKIISQTLWEQSQSQLNVVLPTEEGPFIHLAREDQLDRIIAKYWSCSSDYIILKIRTRELPGRLAFEANPGGTNKYYHLYGGCLPMCSVVETMQK